MKGKQKRMLLIDCYNRCRNVYVYRLFFFKFNRYHIVLIPAHVAYEPFLKHLMFFLSFEKFGICDVLWQIDCLIEGLMPYNNNCFLYKLLLDEYNKSKYCCSSFFSKKNNPCFFARFLTLKMLKLSLLCKIQCVAGSAQR